MDSGGSTSSGLTDLQRGSMHEILRRLLWGDTGLPGIGETYPPSTIQTGLFDWANQNMGGLLGGTDLAALTPAAQGYFETSIAEPALKQFQERIAPGLLHTQAVSGTLGTGAAMRARERMGTDLASGLAGAKAQFTLQQQEAAKNRLLSAIPMLGALGQAQYALANPVLQPHIQSLLQLVGQPTQTSGGGSSNIWGK